MKQLTGEARDRARAGAKLQADLASDVFASFGYIRDSGEHNRNVVILVGNEFRYTLKPDEDGSGCVVTAVAQPEFEALEGLRRRSLLLPPVFTWTVLEPANRELAKGGLSRLIGVIDDFVEGKKEAASAEAGQEGDELFDLWLRILDAREELARGELAPIAYRARRVVGREVVFTLVEPCELDLIGTEWRVQDVRAGRKYAWGEVKTVKASPCSSSASRTCLRQRHSYRTSDPRRFRWRGSAMQSRR